MEMMFTYGLIKTRMPKEWTGPSEYFTAGLYGGQSRKAIFQSVLPPEGRSRGFNAMEFEEAAADLSLKKSKSSSYEGRDKIYPPYSLDESMDLSTKWRVPPSMERPPKPHHSLEGSGGKRSKSSHHSRMLPRKRTHEQSHVAPDVIVLSDEEQRSKPQVNGHTNGYSCSGTIYEPRTNPPDNDDIELLELLPLPPERKWDPAELHEKRRLLRELRDELRSEEMKLVLLKKLHQSQMIKENLMNQAVAVASKIVPPGSGGKSASGAVAPPPLVRSGGSKALSQMNQSSMMSSPLLLNQTTHGGPPPLIGQRSSNSSSSSSNIMGNLMRSSHNSSSRAPVTTPPNMVMGYNLHNLPQSVQSSQHQISMNQPQSCPSPSLQPDNQTPAQRQAAAKLALRKQLEKTLLQIPPPKPPPPEMHFVPNANNQEFICLLGLEKAVDLITDDPNRNRAPPEPFECVQCGTDFSPVWKWQDVGGRRTQKPSVICETCVTSNIKKALKAEHTNRLKTAFVKALQQEQEIEQRMAQGAGASPPPLPAVSPTPCSTPSTTTCSTPPVAPRSPGIMSSTSYSPGLKLPSASNPSASLLQHLPKLSAAHQSLLHAQAQQLQHFAQTMQQQQPQPAHMYPFAPLLAAQAYSYQLLGKNPLSSAELQRQYLLDMIPPRSLPQGSINWKT